MEPQIRYVRSFDGTRIAYATTGSDSEIPIVCAPNPDGLVSIEVEWKIPRLRAGIERISESHCLVRVDARGRGYSDHDVDDGSFGRHVSDLSAVIEALDRPQVHLVGGTGGALSGRLCVAYAAEHSDRVRTLTLFGTGVGEPVEFSPMRTAIYALSRLDFEFYKKVLALHAFGWDDGRIVADAIAGLTTDERTFGRQGWRDASDLTHLLAAISCPVLVCHIRMSNYDLAPMSVSRHLASEIRDAFLRVVDINLPSAFDAHGTSVDALLSFVEQHDPKGGADRGASGTAVILYVDIVDSTALTERLGDAAFREKARALDGAMRTAVREHAGDVIDAKTLGDGFLATFASASQAVGAALACAASGDEMAMPVHVGLHAGDVIREEENVFGGAVNIAARISALSAAGEVLVSATVRDLGRTSAGVVFEDRGEFELKGVGEAVRVYAVREKGG